MVVELQYQHTLLAIMILENLSKDNIKGSSLTFSAHGGRGKEKYLKPAEKNFCRSEDGSAGGGWGEECRAVRAKSEKPRRLLVQSRTPQESFVFLLEEKIGRAQIRNRKQNFPVVWRALASGGGAGQFRSKWVRAKFRIEHKRRN